jgi:hypothetical protein
LLSAAVFPAQIEEAYQVGSRTLGRIPRPALAFWYGHIASRDSLALTLARRLDPAVDLCLISSSLADLERDGWQADLVVEYAEQSSDPDMGCGMDWNVAHPTLAVFVPSGFSYQHAGNAGNVDDPPSDWTVEDGFLFRRWSQTDFPSIDIWYLRDGRLVDADVSIQLTDTSEEEYALETKSYDRGFIGWGVPEGLFHVEITAEGSLQKAPGMPPELAQADSHGIELSWSEGAFFSSDGSKLPETTFDGSKLRLPPMSHLYVSGCNPIQGFARSDMLPGALMPDFAKSPRLQCGASGEDNPIPMIDVTLDR